GTAPGAVVLALAPTTIANADIVNDNSVFGGFRGFDNAGADVYDNFIVSISTNGVPAFTCPPTNQVVLQGRPATIYGYLHGPLPWAYQWLKKGNPIAGATDWKYSIAAATLADADNYALRVTSAFGVITSPAMTLTVTPDTFPPVLVSAGSLDGCTVGAC